MIGLVGRGCQSRINVISIAAAVQLRLRVMAPETLHRPRSAVIEPAPAPCGNSWSTFPLAAAVLGFFHLAFYPGWPKAPSTMTVATQVFRAGTD